jgi:hypothetical protein
MKHLFAILLLLAFAFQSFSKLVVLACHEINKDYIASTLCENRSRPKLNCNGKCHLAKKMKHENECESKPYNLANEKYEVLWHNEIANHAWAWQAEVAAEHALVYQIPVFTIPGGSIFHPPCA